MRVFSEGKNKYDSGRLGFCTFCRQQCMSHQTGFSLLELIITIALMAIVSAMATLSFNSMQKKSKFESQLREIFADLADARTRAFTQKKVHGIVFQTKNYVMKSYNAESEYSSSAVAAANGAVIMSKSLDFDISKTNTVTAFTDSNSAILFDTTGFTTTATGFTIVMNPVTVSPNLNCLVIHASRVNMGKWNATTADCEFN